MNGFSNPIYSRRKRFLPEYRELFAVLLKIPDEDVRNRVTNAINGIQICPNCKIKQECQVSMDVETQTEDSYLQTIFIVDTEKEDSSINKTETIEKRRRKRKRNYPKVVKTAQHSSNVPVLKQDPNKLLKNTEDIDQVQQHPMLMRLDSNDDAVSMFFENCNSIDFSIDLEDMNVNMNSKNTLERVKYHMAIEWETCKTQNHAGFLPIHEAIVQNELYKLRRQIYVWKFRSGNLRNLTTEDDDNLIQLAVKENCMKSIIDELLKEDLDINEVDNDNNNIIHLAVSHLSNDDDIKQQKEMIQTLESLLQKIDLKILLQRNDDGLTPLHIAVKKNEYLMAEKIINVIDSRLNLKSISGLDDPCTDIHTFTRYYCRQCDNFEGRESDDLKQEILNAADMKRGCSILYFAMELGYEHFIYLLLAHMCNPTTKNLAGSDAKTYYTELGKNASIAGVLDNLITVLQKQ